MKRFFFFALLSCLINFSFGQTTFTQNIKGQVLDADTGLPLLGANLQILDSDPLIGTSTDLDGYYLFADHPVGRYSILCTYLGYKEQVINNVLLTTGKELVLNFELTESAMEGVEIVVTAVKEQNAKASEIATISVKEFDAELASRFAGGSNDVSRMAAGFAGVNANDDSRNDIIIRGNAPSGLLWRADGIDIPNPNHFGSLGATGGPVSILNYKLLEKSIFLTGAFPSTYGNALSGVFDLNLRKGNQDKTEVVGQVSFNGFEFGLEGPFSKKSKASYIFNYRYSVFALISLFSNSGNRTGTGTAIPKYQDLNFKVNIPTQKFGTFSFIGIGGISGIDFLSSIGEEEDPNLFSDSNENLRYKTNMGVLALINKHYYNNKSYGKLSLSYSTAGVQTELDTVSTQLDEVAIYRDDSRRNKMRIAYEYKNKLSAKHSINLGLIVNQLSFNFNDSTRISDTEFRSLRSFEGNSLLNQFYANWQFRWKDKLTLNTGLFTQLFTLNNTYAIEPRINLKYILTPKLNLTLGAGRHSKLQDFQLYLLETELDNGTKIQTNKDLEMTINDQAVVGFEWNVVKGWNFKTEFYYQLLHNAPVQISPSSYSSLNEGADFNTPSTDSLVNEGTGTNYGVELSLEKSFNKGFYLLGTLSLYDSKYKGSDLVERNTAFNGAYVANLLAGKEFKINKMFSIAIDTKITGAGGKRYTEIDVASSRADRETRVFENKLYEEKQDDYFRADVKFTIRQNMKKFSQELSVDIQNIGDNKNIFSESYNIEKDEIQTNYQIGRYPVFSYLINF